MVIEYIRYQIDCERSEAFEEAYARAGGSLIASPRCLGYELSRCMDEPSSYILRIEWDSVDGHLQGFRRSPEFRVFFSAIQPYVGDIQEMRHYEATGVVSAATEAL
ncbi:MAG: antibiotic biosynthesis monooxygenase family protein [Thermomicrobiales bacterium]